MQHGVNGNGANGGANDGGTGTGAGQLLRRVSESSVRAWAEEEAHDEHISSTPPPAYVVIESTLVFVVFNHLEKEVYIKYTYTLSRAVGAFFIKK